MMAAVKPNTPPSYPVNTPNANNPYSADPNAPSYFNQNPPGGHPQQPQYPPQQGASYDYSQQPQYPPQQGAPYYPQVPSQPVMTSPPPQQFTPRAGGLEASAQNYQTALFAQCAQGIHDPTTKYGACGIVAAVLLFPIGLVFLFVDRETRCARCGAFLR